MSLFSNRVRECRPATMFEELEERIVLDASIDSTVHDNPLGGSDIAHGWNLEYSSDPSVSLDHLLDTSDLHAYPGDLGTPTPSITLGVVTPVGSGSTVHLSGAGSGSTEIPRRRCTAWWSSTRDR